MSSQDNWVYTQYISRGTTSYTNPILKSIYSDGVSSAFGYPDATVMSFATNDMVKVVSGVVSYESSYRAFWRLAEQSVEAGSMCIVILEAAHHFTDRPNEGIHSVMDRWFSDMRSMEGEHTYLGYEYTVVIADISEEINADWSRYIGDYIHFTLEGSTLAAVAIEDALNRCPPGRWVYGEDRMKDDVEKRVEKW
jgi:hypothetical protein